MAERILCPKCHKVNGVTKFCIYCGQKLPIDDRRIMLMKENPEAYCLNCARPALKGQVRCECGYEFADIRCSECNTVNAYTNRFCTSCGKKLWTRDVNPYKYPKHIFEEHIINKALPHEFRNTTMNRRCKSGIGRMPLSNNHIALSSTIDAFKSYEPKIDRNLSEIRSRWKVVSPDYCINCLGIVKPDERACPKCGSFLLDDEKRFEFLKCEKESYIKPLFENPDLKWTAKVSEDYLKSLAPAIGESQFEYRERLKWDFSENLEIKNRIKVEIDIKTFKKRSKRLVQTKRYGFTGRKYEEEGELYGMTQDAFEHWRAEERARENEEHLERWKEFWEDK